MLASRPRDRVFYIFDVFVDLVDKKIKLCVLVTPLSKGSKFHRHFEAIGAVV